VAQPPTTVAGNRFAAKDFFLKIVQACRYDFGSSNKSCNVM